MSTLRSLSRARGSKRTQLIRKASQQRKKMINRFHVGADDQEPPEYGDLEGHMPRKYRGELEEALAHPDGEKALELYRKFHGIPYPTEIRHLEVPGPDDQTMVLVSMGRSPEVQLAKSRKPNARRTKSKKERIAAVDPTGKQIWILSGKNKRGEQHLKPVGYAPETHYVPTEANEDAGTFKSGAYWVHKHDDDGGEWPEVFKDQAGNFVYGPGTYRVKEWIER